MPLTPLQILTRTHPYDQLPNAIQEWLAEEVSFESVPAEAQIYDLAAPLPALYLILAGHVDIRDNRGQPLSLLGPGNSFGERGLMKDGYAVTSARAREDVELLAIPAAAFQRLLAEHPPVARFFDRAAPARARDTAFATRQLGDIMTKSPVTSSTDITGKAAAELMRDHRVSSLLLLTGGVLQGIVTVHDLTYKLLAAGRPADTKLSEIMTRDLVTLPPDALVSDALHMMVERHISHLPVMDRGMLVGILSQSDLTRVQAQSAAAMIQDIAAAPDAAALPAILKSIPEILVQLVSANHAHQTVTRAITDIADATTRRLLALAEQQFGPPPVPYLWLACGSQGRQEQTGVSDQDNCLIISDEMTPAHDTYFSDLAGFVSDGLDACGYVYCPGDMMATNPRWRQPLAKWKEYFGSWIANPDTEAQMLASVMFDLRPIGGETSLFANLQAETLDAAAGNSIFVAHMVSNSLKHEPPLGLFRGLATLRSGEHKHQIDMKHSGVVPIVDLGRIYALQGQLAPVNTRARLVAAIKAGQVSPSGGADLLDAYDMIADTRLLHQSAQISKGEAPDNFLTPTELSAFERSHLRDAFVVVKTMQSAAGQGRGTLS